MSRDLRLEPGQWRAPVGGPWDGLPDDIELRMRPLRYELGSEPGWVTVDGQRAPQPGEPCWRPVRVQVRVEELSPRWQSNCAAGGR